MGFLLTERLLLLQTLFNSIIGFTLTLIVEKKIHTIFAALY